MTRSFLGIPVDGDIIRHEGRAQRPLEELRPILRAVLDEELITEFGWRQYTPYFNDGDPCVFGVSGTWFHTVDNDADTDLEDLTLGYNLSVANRRWNDRALKWDEVVLAPNKAALHAKCRTLEAAVEGGEFYNVLLEAFGDHAQVTVQRNGITVGFYEHD